MAFFLILSWLAPKLIRSHPEETCREPPTFPAQPSQSCFQDTKAHVSPLPPGFSNCCLMGHTLTGHVMDSQRTPASTTQIKPLVTWPSAGGGRSEKHLYTCCLVTKSRPTLVIPWTVAHQVPLSMGFSGKFVAKRCF